MNISESSVEHIQQLIEKTEEAKGYASNELFLLEYIEAAAQLVGYMRILIKEESL